MIVSLRPPYDITPRILQLVSSVSEKIGAVHAGYLDRSTPQLRKQNQIKTVHSSLQIEGNTLTEGQITAILENKRVLGPVKDIREVKNAIAVYDSLKKLKAASEESFLKAHRQLMDDLIADAGKYRKKGVGIVKGSNVEHVAPPYENVSHLMRNLFRYVKNDPEIALIKSCVFHYEMEFIHPFTDGNGRMGRLWQTVILMEQYPLFGFLPFETLISKDQEAYYSALSQSDRRGKSTPFIEYMLGIIDRSLAEIVGKSRKLNEEERMDYFLTSGHSEFTRKDYMQVFDISSASASRDLRNAVDKGILVKTGDKKTTVYTLKKTGG